MLNFLYSQTTDFKPIVQYHSLSGKINTTKNCWNDGQGQQKLEKCFKFPSKVIIILDI